MHDIETVVPTGEGVAKPSKDGKDITFYCKYAMFTVAVVAVAVVVTLAASASKESSNAETPVEVDIVINVGSESRRVNTPVPNRTFAELLRLEPGGHAKLQVIAAGGNLTTSGSTSIDLVIDRKKIENMSDAEEDRRMESNEQTFTEMNDEVALVIFEVVDGDNASMAPIFGANITSISCFENNSNLFDCEYHDQEDPVPARRLWWQLKWVWRVVRIGVKLYWIVRHVWEWVDGCFPGDAEVYTPDGGKLMRDLQISDQVLTRGGYSPVYLFGHYDRDVLTEMVHIETALGHSLSLTGDHYMSFANGSYAAAKHAAAGDSVWALDDSHRMVETRITKVVPKLEVGLFNPYTYAGELVVNRVLASAHSSWFLEGLLPQTYIPAAYDLLLAPVRLLHRTMPAWVQRFSKSVEGTGSLDKKGALYIVRAAAMTILWSSGSV